MLFITVISLLVAGTSAGTLQPGPCPNITGVNFDMNRFVGKWREYASTDDVYHNTLRCVTHFWDPPVNGVSNVFSTGITSTGLLDEVESQAYLSKPDNGIHMTTVIPMIGTQSIEFWDLEDIYDNDSICWSCKEVGSYNLQTITIWTRRNIPRGDVIGRARQLAGQRGLAAAHFGFYFNPCN
ncbi:apolipoprotein D-like [Cotesia glomerata]|uniref:Uncharacterized protein n=1 Tax=Cotesia glomerata TaxID=32391 RepID=A0AAV7IT97_COTGL|nr:apolipoprotein D-like [Cotesia glomerata]KAH0555007.1 hypothetical protein KQX54_014650 [Cotesia glomerata]